MHFKNMIIWRHTEATLADFELGEDDMARALTSKGQRQAKHMAAWLNKRLPKNLMLLCSPAVRAQQTAEALKYHITVHAALRPGANLREILDALAEIDVAKSNVLIVGHQPWLGQLVTHLTGFSGAELNIKKGAIWWLRQSLIESTAVHTRYNVIAVQAPSLLT